MPPTSTRTRVGQTRMCSDRADARSWTDRFVPSRTTHVTGVVTALAGRHRSDVGRAAATCVPGIASHRITPYPRASHSREETSMASRRRLEERFAFASRAVHHHRLAAARSWRSSRAASCCPRSPSTAWGMRGEVRATRATCGTASTTPTPITRRTQIVFDSTVFSTPQTITLAGSQLELEDTGGTQTITGPAAGVTISGGGNSRVFQLDDGVTASISGLTISGGSTYSSGFSMAAVWRITARRRSPTAP